MRTIFRKNKRKERTSVRLFLYAENELRAKKEIFGEGHGTEKSKKISENLCFPRGCSAEWSL